MAAFKSASRFLGRWEFGFIVERGGRERTVRRGGCEDETGGNFFVTRFVQTDPFQTW